jgi:hypothetical protein
VNLASRFVVGSVLIGNLASSQVEAPNNIERWNTIDHLCGELAYVKAHSDRDGAIHEHAKTLKNITIKLYERGDAKCCDGSVALAEARTHSGGKFAFATVRPGTYWLVTIVRAHEYKLPISLSLRPGSSMLCSHQRFGVYDSGDFRIEKSIDVD